MSRGRPRQCPDAVVAKIVALRRDGLREREICDELNAGGISTPGGGSHWTPAHVSRQLHSRAAGLSEEELKELGLRRRS